MNIEIKLENEIDYKMIENMTREAFWNVYRPGCDEHLMVHQIRKVPAFVDELSFVAWDHDVVVGNIMYTKAKVIDNEHHEHEVLCMGPIGVLPAYQKQGIGSMLITHSVEQAKELGYKSIIIYGDPKYYHRFGFVNAITYGIQTSSGDNFEAFMALELCQDGLSDVSGKYYEDDAFTIDKEVLEMFDKDFPFKEKYNKS